MKSIKKIFTTIISLVLVVGLVGTSCVFADDKVSDNVLSIVDPYDYMSVADSIEAAEEVFTVTTKGDVIYYYWSSNYFVVKDHSGYYLVNHNADYTWYNVNGRDFTVSQTAKDSMTSRLTRDYPTPWYTQYNEMHTYNVGGMPVSVVSGIIAGAIGTMVSGQVVSIVVGAVIGALLDMYLNEVFPADYKITIWYLKKYRILEPALPMVVEYYERVVVYGGTSNNLYANVLYNNSWNYTEYHWE